jgi:hypothetical protein
LRLVAACVVPDIRVSREYFKPIWEGYYGLVRTVALEIVSAKLKSESFAVQDVLETYTSIPPWSTAWNVLFGY